MGFPFGLSDITLSGSLGETIDLPAARTLKVSERIRSGENGGDDRISAAAAYAEAIEWEMEGGGISLEAWALMTGRTAVEAGLTPGRQMSLVGRGGECFPEFGITGSAREDDCRTTTIELTGCRLTKLEGTFQGGEFFVTGCAGVATSWMYLTPMPIRWPLNVLVGTTDLGIYLTGNFTGPSGQMPTWRAINDGLDELKIRQVGVDPFAKTSRQFCLTNTSRNLYRRYTGISDGWDTILTQAQARMLIGMDAGKLYWFAADRAVEGRLYALFSGSGTYYDTGLWLLGSETYGDTWEIVRYIVNSGVIRFVGNLIVSGDAMWMTANHGTTSNNVIAHSPDRGVTWYQVDVSVLSGDVFAHVPILATDHAYFNGNGTNGPDLGRATYSLGSLSREFLQTLLHLGVQRPDGMWHSAADVDFQRILKGGKLYVTSDGWANVVNSSPPLILSNLASITAPVQENENWLIFGVTAYGGVGNHTVYVMDGDASTDIVGRGGPHVDTPPYDYSIPPTSGGICYYGVQPLD